jgi:hypothetical protein
MVSPDNQLRYIVAFVEYADGSKLKRLQVQVSQSFVVFLKLCIRVSQRVRSGWNLEMEQMLQLV